jgi:hypothetical protein
MKLGNKGFLSANLRVWSAWNRRRFKKWFGLVDGLSRGGMKVLGVVEPDPKKNKSFALPYYTGAPCKRSKRPFSWLNAA